MPGLWIVGRLAAMTVIKAMNRLLWHVAADKDKFAFISARAFLQQQVSPQHTTIEMPKPTKIRPP